jgi:hypothetical protein
MADILTGATSFYPNGVDTFEFMDNYEGPDYGEDGDVVKAQHRNHLADSIITLESDLGVHKDASGATVWSAPTSVKDDTHISCANHFQNPLKVNTEYTCTIGEDILPWLPTGGTIENEQAVVLVSGRPTSAFDVWSSGVDAKNAMVFEHWVTGNTVHFKLLDPKGEIARTSYYITNKHAGIFLMTFVVIGQK